MCGHGYGKTPGTSCKFKESNKVEVVVEPETPEIVIHKEQRLGTSGTELHNGKTDGQAGPGR